jgi:hypothetical protein
VAAAPGKGQKTAFPHLLYQDRLGTNIGQTHKNAVVPQLPALPMAEAGRCFLPNSSAVCAASQWNSSEWKRPDDAPFDMRKFAPVSYPPLGSAALAAQKQVGNVETRKCGRPSDDARSRRLPDKCQELMSHSYIKMLSVPRRARDKHRENSKKDRRADEDSLRCFAQTSLIRTALMFLPRHVQDGDRQTAHFAGFPFCDRTTRTLSSTQCK